MSIVSKITENSLDVQFTLSGKNFIQVGDEAVNIQNPYGDDTIVYKGDGIVSKIYVNNIYVSEKTVIPNNDSLTVDFDKISAEYIKDNFNSIADTIKVEYIIPSYKYITSSASEGDSTSTDVITEVESETITNEIQVSYKVVTLNSNEHVLIENIENYLIKTISYNSIENWKKRKLSINAISNGEYLDFSGQQLEVKNSLSENKLENNILYINGIDIIISEKIVEVININDVSYEVQDDNSIHIVEFSTIDDTHNTGKNREITITQTGQDSRIENEFGSRLVIKKGNANSLENETLTVLIDGQISIKTSEKLYNNISINYNESTYNKKLYSDDNEIYSLTLSTKQTFQKRKLIADFDGTSVESNEDYTYESLSIKRGSANSFNDDGSLSVLVNSDILININEEVGSKITINFDGNSETINVGRNGGDIVRSFEALSESFRYRKLIFNNIEKMFNTNQSIDITIKFEINGIETSFDGNNFHIPIKVYNEILNIDDKYFQKFRIDGVEEEIEITKEVEKNISTSDIFIYKKDFTTILENFQKRKIFVNGLNISKKVNSINIKATLDPDKISKFQEDNGELIFYVNTDSNDDITISDVILQNIKVKITNPKNNNVNEYNIEDYDYSIKETRVVCDNVTDLQLNESLTNRDSYYLKFGEYFDHIVKMNGPINISHSDNESIINTFSNDTLFLDLTPSQTQKVIELNYSLKRKILINELVYYSDAINTINNITWRDADVEYIRDNNFSIENWNKQYLRVVVSNDGQNNITKTYYYDNAKNSINIIHESSRNNTKVVLNAIDNTDNNAINGSKIINENNMKIDFNLYSTINVSFEKYNRVNIETLKNGDESNTITFDVDVKYNDVFDKDIDLIRGEYKEYLKYYIKIFNEEDDLKQYESYEGTKIKLRHSTENNSESIDNKNPYIYDYNGIKTITLNFNEKINIKIDSIQLNKSLKINFNDKSVIIKQNGKKVYLASYIKILSLNNISEKFTLTKTSGGEERTYAINDNLSSVYGEYNLEYTPKYEGSILTFTDDNTQSKSFKINIISEKEKSSLSRGILFSTLTDHTKEIIISSKSGPRNSDIIYPSINGNIKKVFYRNCLIAGEDFEKMFGDNYNSISQENKTYQWTINIEDILYEDMITKNTQQDIVLNGEKISEENYESVKETFQKKVSISGDLQIIISIGTEENKIYVDLLNSKDLDSSNDGKLYFRNFDTSSVFNFEKHDDLVGNTTQNQNSYHFMVDDENKVSFKILCFENEETFNKFNNNHIDSDVVNFGDIYNDNTTTINHIPHIDFKIDLESLKTNDNNKPIGDIVKIDESSYENIKNFNYKKVIIVQTFPKDVTDSANDNELNQISQGRIAELLIDSYSNITHKIIFSKENSPEKDVRLLSWKEGGNREFNEVSFTIDGFFEGYNNPENDYIIRYSILGKDDNSNDTHNSVVRKTLSNENHFSTQINNNNNISTYILNEVYKNKELNEIKDSGDIIHISGERYLKPLDIYIDDSTSNSPTYVKKFIKTVYGTSLPLSEFSKELLESSSNVFEINEHNNNSIKNKVLLEHNLNYSGSYDLTPSELPDNVVININCDENNVEVGNNTIINADPKLKNGLTIHINDLIGELNTETGNNNRVVGCKLQLKNSNDDNVGKEYFICNNAIISDEDFTKILGKSIGTFKSGDDYGVMRKVYLRTAKVLSEVVQTVNTKDETNVTLEYDRKKYSYNFSETADIVNGKEMIIQLKNLEFLKLGNRIIKFNYKNKEPKIKNI